MDTELLMLCHKDTKRIGLCGNYVSEKLDGQRCFWDGGITVGMKIRDVPWANKYDKRKQEWISNGLWSRLGNKVHAPDYWLKQLPTIMLDGELWAGYEHRQYLMQTIKKEDGTCDWSKVQYRVYDSPPVKRFLSERVVNYSGRKHLISGAMEFGKDLAGVGYGAGFSSRYAWLREHCPQKDNIVLHEQYVIPNGIDAAKAFIGVMLDQVLAKGGEGLVVKGASSLYECARSHGSIKIKPFEDGEGTVVGWIAGEETAKGSRLLGMMGSLVLRLANGRELMLSGFTDQERQLMIAERTWATHNPGARAPEGYQCGFKTGLTVTYKYRGLTADGIPMEARYWRERSDE
jgi:DNA ligase-1